MKWCKMYRLKSRPTHLVQMSSQRKVSILLFSSSTSLEEPFKYFSITESKAMTTENKRYSLEEALRLTGKRHAQSSRELARATKPLRSTCKQVMENFIFSIWRCAAAQ